MTSEIKTTSPLMPHVAAFGLTAGLVPAAAAGPAATPSLKAPADAAAAVLTLPKGKYAVADLPNLIPPYIAALLCPEKMANIRAARVGLEVPKDTAVRIALTPLSTVAPALKGVQTGLFQRVFQGLMSTLATFWGAIVTLLGLRSATASQSPKALTVVPSSTLKGTLIGVPAWLAHQEVKSLSYDAFGVGSIEGRFKLFSFISLPGLQSAWTPSFLRLQAPPLDLARVQQFTAGLSGVRTSDQSSATKEGLFDQLSAGQKLFDASALSMSASASHFEASATVSAALDPAGAAPGILQMHGDMRLSGDLATGAASADAPITFAGTMKLSAVRHAGIAAFANDEVFNIWRAQGKYDGKKLTLAMAGDAETQNTLDLSQVEHLTGPLGPIAAGLWASSEGFAAKLTIEEAAAQSPVGTISSFWGDESDAQSISSSSYETASTFSTDDAIFEDALEEQPASAPPSPQLMASGMSTPPLTIGSSASSVSLPSLLTLGDAHSVDVDAWRKDLMTSIGEIDA